MTDSDKQYTLPTPLPGYYEWFEERVLIYSFIFMHIYSCILVKPVAILDLHDYAFVHRACMLMCNIDNTGLSRLLQQFF